MSFNFEVKNNVLLEFEKVFLNKLPKFLTPLPGQIFYY